MDAVLKRYGQWMMILCLTALWFGTLQYRYLITPDEGRYAEIAREMVQTGDWITPRLNGLKYFEKPALQYWASALIFKIGGISEFTARLWPALTGFFAAFFMGFVASRIWNKETGQIATLVLLSCVWWMGNGHFLTLDMGLNAFLAVSLGSFLLAQREKITDKIARFWMLISWAAAALAVLSKGIIGIVIPGAALVLYSLWQSDWRLWTKLHLGKGILLFCLITAPWFILVSLKNPNFAYFFFIEEHFLRYATKASRRDGNIYYFVFPLLVGLIPWVSFLPQALKHLPYKRTAQFSTEKFLLVWVGFVFVFFSLSQSKLPSYILPVFPPLALLIAHFIQRATLTALRIHAWLLWLIVGVFIISAGLLYTLPAPEVVQAANQRFSLWVMTGGLVFMVCTVGALWCVKSAKKWGMILCFTAAGLIAVQIPALGHRTYGPRHSGYFMAQALKPYLQPSTPLYIVGFYDQTLPFYLQRTIKLVNYFDEFTMGLNLEPSHKISVSQFITRWQSESGAIAIMEQDQYKKLRAHGVIMPVIITIEDKLAVIAP